MGVHGKIHSLVEILHTHTLQQLVFLLSLIPRKWTNAKHANDLHFVLSYVFLRQTQL